MPNVKFYLKKPEPATGKSLIYLQVKYFNRKFVWSFRQTIDPVHWDKDRCRVLINEETERLGMLKLNDLLNKIECNFQKIYLSELSKKIPAPHVLKSNLNRMIKWGSIIDRIKELKLSKIRRDELQKSYVKQLLLKRGWPKEIVLSYPWLLEIKVLSTKTIRALKQLS